MKKAVYPGSFDPPTWGHLDVIRRASRMFDRVLIGIAFNESKRYLFTAEERAVMVREITADIPNVEIEAFKGMTVNFVRSRGADLILRGIRSLTDFEFEFRMALTNRQIAPDIETLFVMADERYSHFSSNIAKEIANLGGPTEEFVPPYVAEQLRKKLDSGK